jgi:hypothetical protein
MGVPGRRRRLPVGEDRSARRLTSDDNCVTRIPRMRARHSPTEKGQPVENWTHNRPADSDKSEMAEWKGLEGITSEAASHHRGTDFWEQGRSGALQLSGG